jgi:biofilm PGA synthesis protein PgaD
MKHLIIDRPTLQTSRQRMLFGSMTLLFWALWIYLWLPILALVGWYLGVKIAYTEMVVKNGFTGLLHLLGWYAAVISIMGASLITWAYYNFARFRQVTRRKRVVIATKLTPSERYGIGAEVLDAWSRAPRLVLLHDADGKLLGTADVLGSANDAAAANDGTGAPEAGQRDVRPGREVPLEPPGLTA